MGRKPEQHCKGDEEAGLGRGKAALGCAHMRHNS